MGIVANRINTSEALKVLQSALKEKGFFLTGSAYADRYAKDLKGLSDRELFVFNRGINKDGTFSGKSNYFVMALRTKDSLRVFMSNPDESDAATNFGYDKLVIHLKYSSGKDCEAFVSNVIDATMKYSGLKPELSYRIFLHNHLSEIGGEMLNVVHGMRDDGRASDRAFLQNLLLFNADIGIATCHNHFPEKGWRVLASESLKYGVRTVPGTEATLPLSEYDSRLLPPYDKMPSPNGPHVLLLFDSPELASSFWQENLSNRIFSYAPCASQGVELLKLYDIIDKKYRDHTLCLPAHLACDPMLPDVGLVNRLAKGEIRVDEMIAILNRSQGISHFNAVVGKTPLDFEAYERQVLDCRFFSDDEKTRRIANIKEAHLYLKDLLVRHRLGTVFAPNNINIALAREFSAAGFMDTDGHDFDWLYTKAGRLFWFNREPGLFAAGHNWIRFKEPPIKPPGVEFLFKYLRDYKECKSGNLMGVEEAKPKIYYVLDKKTGVSDIAPGRKNVPFLQKAFNLLQSFYYYTHKQGPVLAKNLFRDKNAAVLSEARGSIPPNWIA